MCVEWIENESGSGLEQQQTLKCAPLVSLSCLDGSWVCSQETCDEYGGSGSKKAIVLCFSSCFARCDVYFERWLSRVHRKLTLPIYEVARPAF